MHFLISLLASFLFGGSALAQVFVTGQGGAAALSNAAAATGSPPSASNYDSKVGNSFNAAVGYHYSDWVSFEAGYIWNRNRIISSEVTGSNFRQFNQDLSQHAVSGEFMVYFRPRSSRIRPYLSAGPAWVRLSNEDKVGFRTAVGVDLMIGSGWGIRYSFAEMISANPFAAGLRPPAEAKLMNFQNLFGFVKVF